VCQLCHYLLRMRFWLSFFVDFHTCYFENGQNKSHLTQSSLQSTTPPCRWIVYEEVLALDMTIFHNHCQYDRLWYCILRVKILKRKMTISREAEGNMMRLKMLWDHNNIVEKDASVRFERGVLFLMQTLNLFVRQRLHNNCYEASYLDNQSSNDEARTCPELAMTL